MKYFWCDWVYSMDNDFEYTVLTRIMMTIDLAEASTTYQPDIDYDVETYDCNKNPIRHLAKEN